VESGQRLAAVAWSLRVAEQTLYNWIELNGSGQLKSVVGKI
jgi:hypothetical protein